MEKCQKKGKKGKKFMTKKLANLGKKWTKMRKKM